MQGKHCFLGTCGGLFWWTNPSGNLPTFTKRFLYQPRLTITNALTLAFGEWAWIRFFTVESAGWARGVPTIAEIFTVAAARRGAAIKWSATNTQLGRCGCGSEIASNLKNRWYFVDSYHNQKKREGWYSQTLSRWLGKTWAWQGGADLEESILHTHLAFHDACVGKPLLLMTQYFFLVTSSAYTVKYPDAICIFSGQLHREQRQASC